MKSGLKGVITSLIYLVASIVIGAIFYFIFYALTGADYQLVLYRVPGLATEICLFADQLHPLTEYKLFKNLAGKKTVWPLFFTYYACEIVLGFISYWAQHDTFCGIFAESQQSKMMNEVMFAPTAILMHQMISFATLVFPDLLTDGKWTKQTGFAKAFIMYAIAWILFTFFIPQLNNQMQSSSQPTYTWFYFFGPIFTAMILSNLLFTNIYTPQIMPELYKKNAFCGENRCGNMLAMIFVLAIITYLICIILSFIPGLKDYAEDSKDDIYVAMREEIAWGYLCATWLGFTILQPAAKGLWQLCKKFTKKFWANFVIYTVIQFVLCIILAIVFFYLHKYIEGNIFLNVFVPKEQRDDDMEMPMIISGWYWNTFTCANIFYTLYLMQNEFDAAHPQKECVQEETEKPVEEEKAPVEQKTEEVAAESPAQTVEMPEQKAEEKKE